MSVQIQMHKVTADGEQISVAYILEKRDYDQMETRTKRHIDVIANKETTEIIPGKPLVELLAPYFQLLDDRLLLMNKRVMAMNYLAKKLPPDAQVAINNVLDVLHGKTTGPATEEVLAAARREYEEALAKREAETKNPQGSPTSSPTDDLIREREEDAELL